LAVAPASGLIDSAAVEAAIIAGRQLIQFLGLGIEFRGNERPSLKSKTCYERYKKGDDYYTAEVKVVNVGGGFTEMADSTEKEKRTLAEFLHGASKAGLSGRACSTTVFFPLISTTSVQAMPCS
jgi:hypothetical protein